MNDLLWHVDRTDLTNRQLALGWVVGICAGIGVAAFLLLAIF